MRITPTSSRPFAALALAAALAFTASCSPTSTGVTRTGDEVSGTGTIRHFTVEGGFFAIRGDDSVTYDPTNLPLSLHRAGVRVRFAGRIRDDMMSFHMVGPIVELVEIKER